MGAAAELEAADALAQLIGECRRTIQYTGRSGCADVTCEYAPGLHIEVKRTERLNPYLFMDQAIRDSTKTKRTPIVVCRSSFKPWLVVVRLSDLPALAQQIVDARNAAFPPSSTGPSV